MSETPLLDFSSTKPDPIAVAAAGFVGVIGYFKPLQAGGVPNPKELTADYITRARAAGLAVATVFETTTDRAMSGAAGGTADAATARARAAALGYPTSAVCFAAVDEDVVPAQFGTLTAYLQAFEAGWGGPAGGYGELDLVEHLADVAPSLYRWQTEAWSGHRCSDKAQIFQRAAPSGHWKTFAGTDEDVLCAPIPWFGPAAPQAEPGPVTPVPAPAFDVRAWRAKRGDTGQVFVDLQNWLNRTFPAYSKIGPVAASYGPQTQTVLRELAHRAATDRSYPGSHGDLAQADGANIGNDLAAALYHYGFRG